MTHLNAYGLPVPDAVDPYRDVPAYLQALADAVAPKLANLPVVFVPLRQYILDASGKAAVDMRDKFSRIDAVMINAAAAVPYGGNFTQRVTLAGDAPGTFWIRVLTVPPPDGSVQANGAPLLEMLVWGVPA